MQSRLRFGSAVAVTAMLYGTGCNDVLGIHAAAGDDWDGASGTGSDPSNSGSTQPTSGTTAGTAATKPPQTVDANLPAPADAGTTLFAWANWPMPNPPSTSLPNAQSYDAGGDATVFDNITGLVWQQTVSRPTYTWADARAYCAALSLAGSGWRLPSRIELLSLVDFTHVPTIDSDVFPNTPMDGFWSGSLLAGNAAFAWAVNFGFTVTPSYTYTINSAYHVRCVR